MLLLSQGCCFIQSLLFSYVLREDSMKFKDLFRFPISRPDDVVFRLDAHQSATSVWTTRSFSPDAHQCLEASNSSRLHPSGRNGKSSGRSSEFENIPVFQCVNILASFCVWTKLLKCKDAVNRDSTFRVMSVVSAYKSEEFQVSYQPSGRSSHPVLTLDRPTSSVRTKCSFRPEPILYREVSVPACIHPDVSAACPNTSHYSISF
jgi:hypothetical protein